MEQPTTEQQPPPEDAGELVVKNIMVPCRVPLADEQLALLNLEHAQICSEVRAMRDAEDALRTKLKEEEKERAAAAAKRIADKDATALRLEKDLLSKSIAGETPATEVWNYRTNEVTTTRLDTAEVTSRAMSAEEIRTWREAQPEPPPKQPELPFGKVPDEDEPDDPSFEKGVKKLVKQREAVKDGQRLVETKPKRGPKAKHDGVPTTKGYV